MKWWGNIVSPKTQKKSLDFRLKYPLAGHQTRTLVYSCTLTVEPKGLNIKKRWYSKRLYQICGG